MKLEIALQNGLPIAGRLGFLRAAFRTEGVRGVIEFTRSDLYKRIPRLTTSLIYSRDILISDFLTERWFSLSEKQRELWKYVAIGRDNKLTISDQMAVARLGSSRKNGAMLDSLLGYTEGGDAAGFELLRSTLEERDFECDIAATILLLRSGVSKREVSRVIAALSRKHTSKGILSDFDMASNYSAVKQIVQERDETSALLWSILLYDVTTTFGDRNTISRPVMLGALASLVEAGVSPEQFYEFKRRGYNGVEKIVEAVKSGIDFDTIDSIGRPAVEGQHKDLYDALAGANIRSRFDDLTDD